MRFRVYFIYYIIYDKKLCKSNTYHELHFHYYCHAYSLSISCKYTVDVITVYVFNSNSAYT